ncbi:protein NODULATION SIGNALING PATHWAY 2-like [Typha angustifolia]|uniref:protein NODULATION SIGNALING PATHWAY 2-like n=1 Tax=Typha angustifolia TaxID=59011 RepID=UPI003C30A814
MEIISYPQSPLFSFQMEYEETHAHLQVHENTNIPIIIHGDDSSNDCVYMDTTVSFPDIGYCDASLVYDMSHDSSQMENLVPIQENSLSDLLLAGAEAIEAKNLHLAYAVITKLDDLLFAQDNAGNSFNQSAYYFTRGLRSRIAGNDAHRSSYSVSHASMYDHMSAYQMVQELSPYVKFAHFTANQAIFEATGGDREIHVIDFDVMEGIQWPPLMVDLACRGGTSLWITAVVKDGDFDVVRRTERRLSEFADSINLPLRFDWVLLENLEGIEQAEGCLIVNCMVHQLQYPTKSYKSLNALLYGVRKLNPKMVILVEEELFRYKSRPFNSFVEFFCEALHHYSAMIESLRNGFHGGYEVGLRMVEREMVGPNIEDSVRQFPFWEGGFLELEGFKAMALSSCNVAQAKFLVGLFSRGYKILQQEKGRLALCWKSRPLTSASIWVSS